MDDDGVEPEQGPDPLGGERRHGDDGVGPAERMPDQQPLAGDPVPREGPRRVEDGQVVDRRDHRAGSSQREVDVQPVGQIGRSEPDRAGQRPPDPARSLP